MGQNRKEEPPISIRVLTCLGGSLAPSAMPDHHGAKRPRGELTTTAIPMGCSLLVPAGELGDTPNRKVARLNNKKLCYICPSNKYVDDHHIDCCEGKLSPETIPLCRRCHRTYHDLGVDYFDDEYLDKAIEIENKFRVIHNANLKESVNHKYIDGLYSNELQPMKREDIRRSDYFNKTHGLPQTKETKGSRTPAFNFHLPCGEPLCGWDWVNAHLYDLMDWIPRIEVLSSGLPLLSANIDNAKKLKETIKILRELRHL